MYQLVVIQNGQYGFVHKENERTVLDHPFGTRKQALAAASRRYRMQELNAGEGSSLQGTPEDFTITVRNTDKADFSDHYFIEEI